jgi:signal transduction histidine kinase
MRQGFETWKKTGMVPDSEVWMKRKDGTTFPALISATAACIYHENREIVASNTCIIDATKIYEAKRKLEDANKRLVELDAMKTEFIFTASHELRTPIQPILNFAELAERGNIKPDLALAQIKKEARRLQQLTNDILDVARIEGGNLAFSLEEFSLNDLVRDLFDASVASISPVPIKLSLASHEDAMVVSADRQRMIQVLSNIVGNAAKFTKSGHIEISTSSVFGGRYLEIYISDTGAGIPPEILPSLFLKFATKSVAKGAEHGTGLGLYISRAIVVGHGGKIVGYNNAEAGATFKIWLPGPKVARTSVSVTE